MDQRTLRASGRLWIAGSDALSIYGWDTGRLLTRHWIRGPADFLISWVLPAVLAVMFWAWKRATPGKLMIGAEIVDAKTGGTPTIGQAAGRYLGYFVSLVALCIGYVWVAFDPRKQGWHDKLAGRGGAQAASR